ncbi:MAG: hypothetical protein NWE89_14345 [Candidatus Bathyarchaeota archaeon]|nr:hypothetical protein [Candidatus Bathyarchaeota archaeon]
MPKTKEVDNKVEARARLADFQVKRDGEGNLVPIEAKTEFGTIMVIPFTYGDSAAWSEKMKDVEHISDDDVAEQFSKHIVDPDMSKITGEDIKNSFKPLAIAELLMGIGKASGLEKQMTAVVDEDGNVKVDLGND